MQTVREAPPGEEWRTIQGTLPFVTLRAQVEERAGVVLTDSRHPRESKVFDEAIPTPRTGTVSLKELKREGLFPMPTDQKPGLYHARAAELVCFLVAALGLGHDQGDPRRTARGRPERETLRAHLRSEWARQRDRRCRIATPTGMRSLDEQISALERHAELGESSRYKSALLESAADAREQLRAREIEAEDAFYRGLAFRAPGVKYRVEARGRDLPEVLDEQIVTEARLALLERGLLLDSVNLSEDEVVVSYVIRAGADGSPTTSLERPTAIKRSRGT